MYLTKSRISFFFFLEGSRFGIAGEGIFFFSYRERHPKNVAVKC